MHFNLLGTNHTVSASGFLSPEQDWPMDSVDKAALAPNSLHFIYDTIESVTEK